MRTYYSLIQYINSTIQHKISHSKFILLTHTLTKKLVHYYSFLPLSFAPRQKFVKCPNMNNSVPFQLPKQPPSNTLY